MACQNTVQAIGAGCIAPAPGFKFPYAANYAWDALKWAAANGKSWGADPSGGSLVGGMSAGANLGSVVVHLARDENLSPH
jgi:acetyl esterase/lipase